VKLALDATFFLVCCDEHAETAGGEDGHVAQGEDNVGRAGSSLSSE
jgi:hypothetical protein